jgi:hypothetical protein
MTDYYMGLVIGAGIGYCLAICTMITLWALCYIAAKDETNE